MIGDFTLGAAFGRPGFDVIAVTSDTTIGAQGPMTQVIRSLEKIGEDRLAAPFAFHTFKIADNESPFPADRVFYTSNYYQDLGDSTVLMRHALGFEAVDMNGRTSIGMRLPFFAVNSDSAQFAGAAVGTYGDDADVHGDIGDLAIVLKHALWLEPGRSARTIGLAGVAPTGPRTIGEVRSLYEIEDVRHDGTIQPFVGFFEGEGRGEGWFLQGFSSLDSPFDDGDATLWYNDLAIGYSFRRSPADWITRITPVAELHSTVALDDRIHPLSPSATLREILLSTIPVSPNTTAIGASADFMGASVEYHAQLNATVGVTLELSGVSTLTLAGTAPLLGPHPYDVEAQLQFNYYFGSVGQ
ncbi:MAG: hypothetical protein N2C14_08250, partial [Planctomycetales bacterium]